MSEIERSLVALITNTNTLGAVLLSIQTLELALLVYGHHSPHSIDAEHRLKAILEVADTHA